MRPKEGGLKQKRPVTVPWFLPHHQSAQYLQFIKEYTKRNNQQRIHILFANKAKIQQL